MEVENFKPCNCLYFSPLEPHTAHTENLEIPRNLLQSVEMIPERSCEVEQDPVVTNLSFREHRAAPT